MIEKLRSWPRQDPGIESSRQGSNKKIINWEVVWHLRETARRLICLEFTVCSSLFLL